MIDFNYLELICENKKEFDTIINHLLSMGYKYTLDAKFKPTNIDFHECYIYIDIFKDDMMIDWGFLTKNSFIRTRYIFARTFIRQLKLNKIS